MRLTETRPGFVCVSDFTHPMNNTILPVRPSRRNHGGLLLAALCSFALAVSALGTEAAKKNFNLSADDAAKSLKAFTEQSGEQIVYPVEQMRGVKTAAVKGELTPREALDQMLKDTGLVAVQDEKTGALAVKKDSLPNAERVAQMDSDRPTSQSKIEDGKLVLEKIEVTGSRIRSLNGEATALPVFTLSQVELEQRGVNRLADLRWAIPQLAPSRGYNDNLVNGGTSRAQTVGTSINLRGLGNTTTLILIDGHRIPHTGQEAPGGAGGREDYNMDGIPVSAVERIEILTQGASAIYGADAITGVVNIILKKHFVGSEVRLSYDNTFGKDAAQKTVEFTTGVASGKWRFFASGSLEENNAMWSRDRWFSATSDRKRFGGTSGLDNPPGNTGVLRVSGPALPGLAFNTANIPAGSKGGATLTVADYAAGPFTAGQGIDLAPYDTQIDPSRKQSATARASYAHATWLEVYATARWNRTTNYTTGFPESIFVTLPAAYAGNPFGAPVFLSKYFTDLAPPRQTSYFENPSVTFGAKGKFLSDWEYDASYSWARNVVSDTYTYAPINSALLNAAINDPDPAKRPILAYDSSTPGANPNPAGYFDTLRLNGHHKDTSETTTAELQANGPLYTLPTGTISLAVGVVTELDTVKFFRDGATTFSYVLSKPVRRVTDSYYAEVQVPLLSAAAGNPARGPVPGGGRHPQRPCLRHQKVRDHADL